MTEEAFLALIDPVLRAAGATPEPGEEFHAPALDILRYYGRSVRLNFVPILGSAVSVVVVARQPMDVGFSTGDQTRFLTRLAMAVNGRYPPWGLGGHPKGLAVGMTATLACAWEPTISRASASSPTSPPPSRMEPPSWPTAISSTPSSSSSS